MPPIRTATPLADDLAAMPAREFLEALAEMPDPFGGTEETAIVIRERLSEIAETNPGIGEQ
jgi:hypothetical protein